MARSERSFVPAAGADWLLPFYDPLLRLFGGDAARGELIEQAKLQPGLRALDIGCGTGSLVVLAQRLHPKLELVGLDPDPKALTRAQRKVERAGASVQLDRGFSNEIPHPDASFDRVFSSFMFHHLSPDAKRATLNEVRRVLRPSGSLHLLDFGGGDHGLHSWLARVSHSHENMHDNLEGRLLELLAEAGFVEPCEVAQRRTLFGRIAWYRAGV